MTSNYINRYVPISVAVLLAGCATTPPLVSKVDMITVAVPVREKCIAVEDIPAIPKTHMRRGDAAQLAAGAAADVHELAGYAESADRLLRRCAAQPKESP